MHRHFFTFNLYLVKSEADRIVVIECETEAIRETSVGGFFEQFKDPEQRSKKGVWKLKVSFLVYRNLNRK